jgi:hypothetical protein
VIAALYLGLGLFTACWLVHVVIWRVHRPEAYPIWLPVIFVGLPLIVTALIVVFQVPLLRSLDRFTSTAGFLLYLSISACYMGGYAGVIEYSPSAEILRVVSASMPEGVPVKSLNVVSLSEEALTGKRIRHLLQSGAVQADNHLLRLTGRGRSIVLACLIYRRIFGLREEAKG